VISPDTLSPIPSAIETPENTKEDPDDPEPAKKDISKLNHSFDELYRPSTGAVTKNYLQEVMSL
jgi:hypothetical protein